MTLIDNMVKSIADFKTKYPDPPQTEIKMHPDDYRELRQSPLLIKTYNARQPCASSYHKNSDKHRKGEPK